MIAQPHAGLRIGLFIAAVVAALALATQADLGSNLTALLPSGNEQ